MILAKTIIIRGSLLLLTLLVGCSEEQKVEPVAAPAKKVAMPAAKPAVQEAIAVPEEKAEPEYSYKATNRRDPFAPLLAIRKPLVADNVPLTPLQSYDISQLRLIAVIIGKGAPRAMVIAPDGKGYILRKGIKVGKNDGSVVAISKDGIMVEEKYYDFSGEVRTNNLEILLSKREGV